MGVGVCMGSVGAGPPQADCAPLGGSERSERGGSQTDSGIGWWLFNASQPRPMR